MLGIEMSKEKGATYRLGPELEIWWLLITSFISFCSVRDYDILISSVDVHSAYLTSVLMTQCNISSTAGACNSNSLSHGAAYECHWHWHWD